MVQPVVNTDGKLLDLVEVGATDILIETTRVTRARTVCTCSRSVKIGRANRATHVKSNTNIGFSSTFLRDNVRNGLLCSYHRCCYFRGRQCQSGLDDWCPAARLASITDLTVSCRRTAFTIGATAVSTTACPVIMRSSALLLGYNTTRTRRITDCVTIAKVGLTSKSTLSTSRATNSPCITAQTLWT